MQIGHSASCTSPQQICNLDFKRQVCIAIFNAYQASNWTNDLSPTVLSSETDSWILDFITLSKVWIGSPSLRTYFALLNPRRCICLSFNFALLEFGTFTTFHKLDFAQYVWVRLREQFQVWRESISKSIFQRSSPPSYSFCPFGI